MLSDAYYDGDGCDKPVVDLNELVESILCADDLTNCKEQSTIIERKLALIKQIDGFQVHYSGSRVKYDSGDLRVKCVLALIEMCRHNGSVMCALMRGMGVLPRQDMQGVALEFIGVIDQLTWQFMPNYACALWAKISTRRAKLEFIFEMDKRLWSIKPEDDRYCRELIYTFRMMVTREGQASKRLFMKECREGSLFCALVMGGLTSNAVETFYNQFKADTKTLTYFGDEPLHNVDKYLRLYTRLLDDLDEAGICLLIDQARLLMEERHLRIVIEGLLGKKTSKRAIIEKLTWPIYDRRMYKILSEFEDISVRCVQVAELLVDIDRQDMLYVPVQYMTDEQLSVFFNEHHISDHRVYAELALVNNHLKTQILIDNLEKIERKSEFLFHLINLRVQNEQLSDKFMAMLNLTSGYSWLAVASYTEWHPILLLGFCFVQERGTTMVDSIFTNLVEFLLHNSEFPNHPTKLAVFVCAFTLAIEYSHKTKVNVEKFRHRAERLLKKREILKSKLMESFVDFPVSDQVLCDVMGLEHAESLLIQQYGMMRRSVKPSDYQKASLDLKKAMLQSGKNAFLESISGTKDVDLLIKEMEKLVADGKQAADYSILKDIDGIPNSKLKKICELGLSIFPDGFFKDLFHDAYESLGMVDMGIKRKFSGVMLFKFSHERAMPSVIGAVCAHIERILSLGQDHLRLKGPNPKAINQMVKVTETLCVVCEAALVGDCWEKTLSLLLQFYQTSVNCLRVIIKRDMKMDLEGLIRQVSSNLTRLLYNLIPLAHKLDHDRVKTTLEMGKLKEKEKEEEKKTSKRSQLDAKLAREASRVPRLIFLIESFDCLVVKLAGLWEQPELLYLLYKSAARYFQIQMDEVEAALAHESDTSDVQSGPDQ